MMQPKHGGRDCELSSTGIGTDGYTVDPGEVTRRILHCVPEAMSELGGSVWRSGGGYRASSVDCQRQWLSSGGCIYSDLGHVEVCTPSCLDPLDLVAHSIASVWTAEKARKLAENVDQERRTFSLSTANVDALDPAISFGSHISMAVEESLWEDLCKAWRRPCRLSLVASGIAAAVPFFGAGYLLPMRNRTIYSLSARAHHITRVSTWSTTEAFERGILNSRREPHGEGMQRLHLIGFDFCLSSSALMFSFLQCLLAAAEEDFCQPQLIDPVRALRAWSWGLDPGSGRMLAKARLIDGRELTLPEYIRELATAFQKMAETGFLPATVAPRAAEMMATVAELAEHASEGNIAGCAVHLSWASKLLCLLGLCEDDGAEMGDAATRMLDHDFANTDPGRGVFWNLWDQGMIDPLVTRDQVIASQTTPPADTRAYARARLIDKFAGDVAGIDWSYVELRRRSDFWSPRVRIDLPKLDSLNREKFEDILAGSDTINALVERLEAAEATTESDPMDDIRSELSGMESLPTWSGTMLEA